MYTEQMLNMPIHHDWLQFSLKEKAVGRTRYSAQQSFLSIFCITLNISVLLKQCFSDIIRDFRIATAQFLHLAL